MTEWKVGRYTLLDRIASGGMGEVFLARDDSGRTCALKLMLPHLAEDTAATTAFIQEARIAARASHPNLVQVLELGREGRQLYLALELVHGVSLSRLLRSMNDRGLDVDEWLMLHVGHRLLAALAHLHGVTDPEGNSLHVVHRDVTPANVLVDAQGDVKLADFGIAKARDSLLLTRPGAFKGRLDYVAPETLHGTEADARADVYSAALVLWTMATGSSPFLRPSEAATVRAIDTEALPAPRRPLSAAVLEALGKGAERRLDLRLPTAASLAALLPQPPPDAAQRLAALVRELFPAELQRLDATEVKLEGPPTAGLPELGVAAHPDFNESRPTVQERLPSRGRGLGVGVVLVALAAFVAGVWRLVVVLQQKVEAADAGVVRVADVVPKSDVPLEAVADAGPADELVVKTPAAPSEPKRPPAPQGSGWLNIDAVPWAQVRVDGRAMGETPLKLKVPSGPHRVELSNPDSKKTRTQRVTVGTEGETRVKEDLR